MQSPHAYDAAAQDVAERWERILRDHALGNVYHFVEEPVVLSEEMFPVPPEQPSLLEEDQQPSNILNFSSYFVSLTTYAPYNDSVAMHSSP